MRHQYVAGTPLFPTLSEQHALKSSLVNGVNKNNLTFGTSYDVKLNFVSDGAGYKNSLGTFTIDADGTISNVKIAAANLSGNGSGLAGGGSYASGQMIVDLGIVPAGTQLGIFILANGYDLNSQYKNFDLTHGHFEAINDKTHIAAKVTDSAKDVHLYFIDDQTGKQTQIQGNFYNTASNSLNMDGVGHTVSGVNANGNLQIGFEDLTSNASKNPNGYQNDNDYNDAVIEVQVAPHVAHALNPVFALSGLLLSDQNGALIKSATVSFASGWHAGDALDFSSILIQANHMNITGKWNTDGSVTFTGNDTVAHYQQLLQSVYFYSSADDPAAGQRAFTVTVTDTLNLSSTSAFDVSVTNSGLQPITPDGNSLYAQVDGALSHLGLFTQEDGTRSLSLNHAQLSSLHGGITMQDGKGNDTTTLNVTDIFDPKEIFTVLGDKGDTLNIAGALLTKIESETHNGHAYNVYSSDKGITLVIDADVTVKGGGSV
jgi:hypothetical protein